MSDSASNAKSLSYSLEIKPLSGTVTAMLGDTVLARSQRAKVMYETRLPPALYFPRDDVRVPLDTATDLQTFCPFKGTANYFDLTVGAETLKNGAWSYENVLSESRGVEGYIAFKPDIGVKIDFGACKVDTPDWGNLGGPVIDWLLRDAGFINAPEDLVAAFAKKLIENGVAVSRMSVMIWSLHPMIAGKNLIWDKSTDAVSTYAPSYEIHNHPAFANSPLRHVSNGLGGVRQKLDEAYSANSFPILEDLRAEGATDYVAMPLPFSDGQINVLTLTCDHPDGFTTANLGLIFECVFVISRYFEVFNQRENARSLLETYVGKRTGARVLGGDVRRGDGFEIEAAILFCDLRNSTRLEEEMGRDDYITLLNHFFETTSDIIEINGGEVLKFIGDAVLAVFPSDGGATAPCAQALAAARGIVQKLGEGTGKLACSCSIGVEFGQVTYGNVGSRERLDFTVIGQAANVAARLCDYGKKVNQPILASKRAAEHDANAIAVGEVSLRNVSIPVQCYGVQMADAG